MYRTSNSRRNSEDENEGNLGIDMEENTATPQKEILSENKSNYIDMNLSSVDGDMSYVQGSITNNRGDPGNDTISKNNGISRFDGIGMGDNSSRHIVISNNTNSSENDNISKNNNISKSKVVSLNDNSSVSDIPRTAGNDDNSMNSSAVKNVMDSRIGNNRTDTPLSELGMPSAQKNARRKKFRYEETRKKRSEGLLRNDEG